MKTTTKLDEAQVFEIADQLEAAHYTDLEAWADTITDRYRYARKVRAILLSDSDLSPADKFRVGCCIAAAFGL